MAEVTNEDLNRIYDKLEPMAADIAVIKTTLKLMPKIPERPCSFFIAHEAEQKATSRTWKDTTVGAVVDVIKTAIVAAVVYVFIVWKERP